MVPTRLLGRMCPKHGGTVFIDRWPTRSSSICRKGLRDRVHFHSGPETASSYSFHLCCVVFVGGMLGTVLRYALSALPATGAFHVGTFAANSHPSAASAG